MAQATPPATPPVKPSAKPKTKSQIKPYIVLCEQDLSRLENRVNELIMKGYKPHGSLVIVEEHSELYHYQPMLLRKVA